MVAEDDAGGCGCCCPSRRRWRLEVVLPSSALPPSCNNGGLRGAPKPVVRCANSVSNAVAPARCMVGGAAASLARKTKAETETTMTTTTTTPTRSAQTTPLLAISRRQGGFNNQQGREAATEGSEVGAEGSTIMRLWSWRTTTAGAAAVGQAAAIGSSRSSSPPPPSRPLATMVVRGVRRSPSCVALMPGKDNNLIIFKQT